MDLSLKRILAYIIDIFIVTFIVMLFTNIKIINPYKEEYNETYAEYRDIIDHKKDYSLEEYEDKIIDLNYTLGKTNWINGSITICCLILYFGLGNMLLKGKTIGKRILKLQLVHKDDQKDLHIGNYLIRTIILNNIVFRILLVVGVFVFGKVGYYHLSTIVRFLESMMETIIFMMVVLKYDNRGLHDMLANSKVINIQEEQRKVTQKNKKSAKMNKK